MTKQLQALVTLQEIDTRLAELGRATTHEKGEPPGSSPGEIKRLHAERARVVETLRPEIHQLYERVRRRHLRAVVPTSRGVCMGCFTRRPTAMVGHGGGLETCERCGRILFQLQRDKEPVAPVPEPEPPPVRPTRKRAARTKP